jgi:hypothetical protein
MLVPLDEFAEGNIIAGPTPLDECLFVEVGHSPTLLESECVGFVSMTRLKQFPLPAGLMVLIVPFGKLRASGSKVEGWQEAVQ